MLLKNKLDENTTHRMMALVSIEGGRLSPRGRSLPSTMPPPEHLGRRGGGRNESSTANFPLTYS